MEKLVFEEITEMDSFAGYTGGCCGDRSDCCTRVCTRDNDDFKQGSLDSWNQFLEISRGVIQY